MMRLVCFVLVLLALSFISVDGASVGHRMKRESCGVMMYRTSNCSNHGYCVSDNIGPHCVCYQGWGGHLCQHAIGGRPQGSSPLTEGDGNGGDDGDDGDNGDDDGDSSTDRPAAQVTEEETREREVTTQGIQEQTTADQNFGGDDDDDDDDDDDAMRTERPRPTEGDGDGDGAIGGGVSEGDRLAILCDDLYTQTNTCSNRQGHCSVDSIGAFCQCNAGYLGIACQYGAENVAGVLEAIVRMMRDPHYRVIGGSAP